MEHINDQYLIHKDYFYRIIWITYAYIYKIIYEKKKCIKKINNKIALYIYKII